MNQAEAELFEQDLQSVSVHEAGHLNAALAFGIPATMTIEIRDDGTLAGGWCLREFHGPEFDSAVVGWAGLVAEHLCGAVSRHRTPLLFPLTEEFFEEWQSEALFHIHELSDTDRQHIVGYPHTPESLRYAVRILTKRKAELLKAAGLLADRTRKQVADKRAKAAGAEEARWAGVPRPDSFPAAFSEFLKTVVGKNGDALPTFCEFLKDDAAEFLRWRDNPLVKPDESALQEAVNEQVVADLAKFRREGFPTPESWRATAKDFQRWSEQRGCPAVTG